MRIIYFGGGQFACPSLRWLNESTHDIFEVITGPPRPAGRGKKLRPTPIAALARELDLPCREEPNVNQPELLDHFRSLNPDVIIVIAFGQKLGPGLFDMPGCRVINIHGSLLPALRGAAPINWAIMNGSTETGLTVIELNEVWDGGAILGQNATPIRTNETAGELHDRLADLAPALLEDVLNKIAAGTDQPLAQDETKASRAPKLSKADAAIDWTQTATVIRNRIHGTWPWPGAYCHLQQPNKQPERIIIARAELVEPAPPSASPGSLDENMNVVCGAGSLRLLEVKPTGGKLMTFRDLLNGRRISTRDRFENG